MGRALFGIAVRKRDGAPVGLVRLAARDLAHLLDTAALLIGWLWPLWDRRGRTFADLLLRTEVHKVDRPQRNVRRPAAVALVAATLLCAAGVGLSYLVVYRHDRAVDAARAQIAAEGPRIVEQMLSYDVDTLQQDFSHAQSLTTDALPAAVDRSTAGGPEGGRDQERILGGEQRGALGGAGARVDAVGDAGPARHRPRLS